jgi:hypothetical protein
MTHWLDKVITLLQARTSNLRELAELAGEDPRTFYRGISLNEVDIEGQDLSGMEFERYEHELAPVANDNNVSTWIKLAASISAAGRQEERVALVIRSVLYDRAGGMEMLARFKDDRAKFAFYAINEIRRSLSESSEDEDQAIIASLIPKFFSYTYPLNRGRLLYFLAKHLASYPIVNQAIRFCLNKTASMFVDAHRSEINELLDAAK